MLQISDAHFGLEGDRFYFLGGVEQGFLLFRVVEFIYEFSVQLIPIISEL